MTSRSERPLSASAVAQVFGIPYSFLAGLITGLVAPLAAVAGMVAAIRFLTGKVPFLGHVWQDEAGERHLSFKLVAPDEAKELYEKHRGEMGADVAKLKAEIQALVEESRAEAKTSAGRGGG